MIFYVLLSYNSIIKFKKEGYSMKKTIKQTLAIAMTAATLLAVPMASMSVAATDNATTLQASNSDNYTFVENHSIIDCTNRYKMDDGRFNFTIKLPAGTDTYAVTLEVTRNDQGEKLFSDRLMYFTGGIWNTSLRLIDSYDGSDYYELITDKSVNAGVGIKLYMNYDGASYMATNNADGSTVEGRGYWLSA